MRLPGQISAAMEVLADMENRHRPAAAALRDWGLAHRFAGSGDRSAIGNIVYDALRWRRSVGWRMDADTPRALVLGTIALKWQTDVLELAGAVADDVHGPGALTPEELQLMQNGKDLSAAPDAVQADVPDWCLASLQAGFQPAWLVECEALASRPPLDLRVNTLKTDRERALRQMARVKAEPSLLSPVGLRVPPTGSGRRHPNIQSDEAWQRGRVEVQDEGSQLCALLSGAQSGNQVLDLCAGAGGKTLALAAMMENRGQIYAYDADRNRQAAIYDRLKRAGVRNVQVRPPDGEDALADLVARMDMVFVDAPCSGSGVWRRHPDAKWRLTQQSLQLRQAEQVAALDQAAAYVRPGGTLVYVTCSVLPEENQDQVDAFCGRNTGFRPVDLAEPFEELTETDRSSAHFPKSGIQLTPARSGTDGFYMSSLRLE